MYKNKERLFFIFALLGHNAILQAQFEKGMFSFDGNALAIEANKFQRHIFTGPSVNYAISDTWIMGISPQYFQNKIDDYYYKAKAISSNIRFFITPKLKRKLYLEESFYFENSKYRLQNEPESILNQSRISFGIGMYRFINKNVAFQHHLNWTYGFYARRSEDKPFGNEFFRSKIEYRLGLQNFANFSKKDTIRDNPFESGRRLADFNIFYSLEPKSKDDFSAEAVYGVFIADKLLFSLGCQYNKNRIAFLPEARYYVPLTKSIAIYGTVSANIIRSFVSDDINAYFNNGLGFHYLLNNNIGVEMTAYYEKIFLYSGLTPDESGYFGLKSGLKYYFR